MNLLISDLIKLFKDSIASIVDQDINLSIALNQLFDKLLDS